MRMAGRIYSNEACLEREEEVDLVNAGDEEWQQALSVVGSEQFYVEAPLIHEGARAILQTQVLEAGSTQSVFVLRSDVHFLYITGIYLVDV